ncbi:MAG: hypothetical protein AAFP03_18935, partial [Cyanobacteria bacterium J06598_3]
MKLTRVMYELALATGAVAGILYISSPQLSPVSAQRPVSTVPAQPARANRALGLAPLVGIAQFVQAPAQYSFVLPRLAEAQVIDAELKGDRMTISVAYGNNNQLQTGKVNGTLDSSGIFQGTYSPQLEQATGKKEL